MNRKEIFSEIYQKQKWGKSEEKYFSGSGSRGQSAELYIDVISDFINKNNIKNIVDIGCGDFYMGNKILEKIQFDKYIGIDLVKDMVDNLNEIYSSNKIKFEYKDAVEDELPEGDLCIIRQVLQHLDNLSIIKILNKIKIYKFCIITEHQSLIPSSYNIDQLPNFNNRVEKQSGVYLDQIPFNFYIKNNIDLLLETDGGKYDGINPSRIRTFLIKNT